MDARVKPAHDENYVWYGPGSAAHRFAKSYALRCVRGTEVHLAKPPRHSYKRGLIARTGEICMTIVYSQIVPSRPMRMLDACLAL
jgi:hypothetical protein